jgi:hypothetical protein
MNKVRDKRVAHTARASTFLDFEYRRAVILDVESKAVTEVVEVFSL